MIKLNLLITKSNFYQKYNFEENRLKMRRHCAKNTPIMQGHLKHPQDVILGSGSVETDGLSHVYTIMTIPVANLSE